MEVKIKVESDMTSEKNEENELHAKNNIQQEPEIEFVLILPPANLIEIKNEEEDDDDGNGITKDERKFTCNICGSKYRTLGHLKIHLTKKVCTRPKTFKCNKCDRVFNRKEHYNHHLMVHSSV
jgi:Zinc finger, C2H2 type